MSAPSAPSLAPDPYLQAENQQAQNDLVSSLQQKTQGDMASLMARYGTQLAMGGYSGGSPLSPTTGGISQTSFGKG